MTVPATEPVPLRHTDSGILMVGTTRVPFDTVIAAYRNGESAEEIAAQYTSLELGDVYAVIAFYLHHPLDVKTYLESRALSREQLKLENNNRNASAQSLRARLVARKEARASDAEVPGR